MHAGTNHAPLRISTTMSGKHVLVTGVTGFLGKVWLAMLLEKVPRLRRVSVLVRGNKEDSALERFEKIVDTSPVFRSLREKHGSRLGEFLGERLEVLDGDVSEPLCGLSEQTIRAFSSSVDVVVHFAGMTDFEADPRTIIKTNIRGAMHVADVAARCDSARMVHISTCFVAGGVSGEIPEALPAGRTPKGKRFDAEREIAAMEALCAQIDADSGSPDSRETRRQRINAGMERSTVLGWTNLYTWTKAMAEQLLSQRNDLKVVVARPAIVECAQTFPFAGWNEGINTSGPIVWLLAATPFRELPCRPDVHFDVIPVDMVARATMQIAAATILNEADGVYQMGTSDTNPLLLRRAIDMTGLLKRKQLDAPDGTRAQKLFYRHLDSSSGPPDSKGFFSLTSLRKLAKGTREFLEQVEPRQALPSFWDKVLGAKVEDQINHATMSLLFLDKSLSRVENMMRLYRPFIHDNDYIFQTDRMRRLSARLGADEREQWGFDTSKVEWRDYWWRVQLPGLVKWCLPLIDGKDVPMDPASEPPFRIQSQSTAAQTESDAVQENCA